MQSSLLFESLFKTNLADAGNNGFLKQLAEEHPYFSPIQFYLLQQTDVHSEAYTKQATKTAVLFNNPYWLNFQLLRMQQPAEIIEQPKEEIQQKSEPANTATPIIEEQTGAIIKEDNMEIAEPAVMPMEELQQSTEWANVSTTTMEEEVIEQDNTIETITAKPFEEKTINVQYSTNIEEKLLFEPLFARDYFASQGIKLSEEILSNDKLGKQLKSFTDWLKTMKKITPERIQIDHTLQNDSAIQTLAEKSNTDGEVLTETMGDIFIQQGKAEKAIEVYQKLSLLNPTKSAYFAAKIEHLKAH